MSEPRIVTIPIVIEQGDDGVWSADVQLRRGLEAHGEGDTEEDASRICVRR